MPNHCESRPNDCASSQTTGQTAKWRRRYRPRMPSTRWWTRSRAIYVLSPLESGLVQVHLSKWTCILRVLLAALISPDLAPVTPHECPTRSRPPPAPPWPTRTARSTKRLVHQTLQRISPPARRAAEADALRPLRPRWRGLHRELDARAPAYRRAQRSRQCSTWRPRDRPHLLW